MLSLWKKIALICLFLFLLSYAFLSKRIFFWGKYLNTLLVLIVSIVGIIVSILGTIIYVKKIKRDTNSTLMNNLLYLRQEGERQNKFLSVVYLLVIPTIAFWIWIGSFTFNEAILMTKDLPYVLSRNYSKVECFVESNDFTYQSGLRHVQYIAAINKLDNKYIFINFEHEYKKIDESSEYIIWYLPNTNLGLKAQKIP
ncbi:hypothetical protein [Clostridium sp. BSD9I1]|uniref:hypothetical protein n=1 Tax=Clostridium sp. BSD9I1 TaxID=2003589 RepID=UPI0016473BA9|nr:hypothetical protein [Clostridium sp. BSD9I1]